MGGPAMFMITLQQVLKLFIFMAIGYVLSKCHILPKETPGILSRLEVHIFLPAITFLTFIENCTVEKLTSDPELILISLISCSTTLIFGTVAARFIFKDRYDKGVGTYAVNCPNTGYIGTPLVLSLFGGETLMKMMIFVIPLSIYTYSEGYRLLTDNRKVNFKSFLAPPLVALFIGAIVGLLQIPFPKVVIEVISGCSDCMGPVAMILTGCIFSQFRFRDILRNPSIYSLVSLRMVVVPLAVLCIGKLLQLSPEMMVLLAAVFAMPTGLNIIVVPSSIGRDCRLGAGMTLVSNLMGLITIPLFFSVFL